MFAENLKQSVVTRQKRGKNNKRIRYLHYCIWARELLRKEIGPEHPQYGYPQAVLEFIRDIAPGDVVGEIKEDAFVVPMDIFCETLDVPRIFEQTK